MRRSLQDKPIILIVDDVPSNLHVLVDYLEEIGYQTRIAGNGSDALRQTAFEIPDLILLDIRMPEMDGFETCMRFKTNISTRNIPIIFITALDDIESKVNGFECGAVDYITKPFNHTEVGMRIGTHLTLLQQKKELERLNLLKNRLFSVLAHDLKNSFNILMSANTQSREAIEDKDEAAQKELCEIMDITLSDTYKLLENLLDWGYIQTGRRRAKQENKSLYKIVEQSLNHTKNRAMLKNIHLENNVQNDLRVCADAYMLESVIRNLLSNAVKFTPKGGHICVAAAANGENVFLKVKDTGCGMCEHEIKTLFRFQPEKRKTGTEGEMGSGLGLVLVKEFIEMQNGTIHVESKEGKGTTFTITIPLMKQEKESQSAFLTVNRD